MIISDKAFLRSFVQTLSNIIQIPVIQHNSHDHEILGILKLLVLHSDFFSKRFHPKMDIEEHYIPAMDPISSLALYSQWESDYQRILT